MNKRMPLCGVMIVIVLLWLTAGRPQVARAAGNEAHRHHHHHGHAPQVSEPVVDMETSPETLKAQTPAKIAFLLKDQEGNPLKDLAITHERILHVVIISEDFGSFAHIHPEDFGPITEKMKEAARFTVQHTFPRSGHYLVALDFGVGGNHFSERFTIDVAGEPAMVPMKKDLSRKKVFDGYEVTLASQPERITAGKSAALRYRITRNGEAVADVEPYLGAAMHIAIVMADLNHFIHAHGDRPGVLQKGHPVGHVHGTATERYGPEIETEVIFPAKGTYKIFSEAKHRGKLLLFDFMVDVE